MKEVRMMTDNRIDESSHHMTEETMTAFLENEKARGASDNMIRCRQRLLNQESPLL